MMCKEAFIRALFDDEGNVCISKHMIQISMTNEEIIRITRNMLLELGIKTGELSLFREAKKNRKAKYGFRVSGRHDLKLFSEKIGFNHVKKNTDLKTLIQNYRYAQPWYGRGDETRNLITQLLIRNEFKNKHEISKALNRPSTSIEYHLLKLEKENIIKHRIDRNKKAYYINKL